MPQGTVKWYDPDKGFGFVAREDGGNDVFLHHSMVGQEFLAEGDRIAFTVGRGPKGERAEDVRVIERSGVPPRLRRPQEPGVNADRPRFGWGSSGGRFYDSRSSVNGAGQTRLEGVVRHFDQERGFGFITTTAAMEDVFFHGSVVVMGPIRAGDAVEFSLGQGPKGPRAMQVRLQER